MQYRFNWGYQAGGVRYECGAEVEFDAETAAFFLRDSPGCISPVVAVEEPIVETRDLAEPPADRMMRRPPGRRKAG